MIGLLLALRDGRHFDGQPSLSGHCGHGWTCRLPGPVAIDMRQPKVGTLKKGLHRPRLSAIIPNLSAAVSLPDCRAVLIQIVALYSVNRYGHGPLVCKFPINVTVPPPALTVAKTDSGASIS